MLNSLNRIFARRATVLPIIAILAIAATACEGVGLTEARQAVDNQRTISDLEDSELRPIELEFESLYEDEVLPRERELEDLWDQVRGIEDGGVNNALNNFDDPWAPGGAAHLIQQEFQERYNEIDRQYRELDVESRRLQLETQWGDNNNGIDPAITAIEDERFALQRELDRLHTFGRRPIEDIYQQMNELNASIGWSDGDIFQAEELNRQIADIQNQLAQVQSSDDQITAQHQQELQSIENELNILRTQGYFRIQDIYNRIAELEQQLQSSVIAPVVTTTNPDALHELELLENEMAAAIALLQQELDGLHVSLDTIRNNAQVQIDELTAQSSTATDGTVTVDSSALQGEIDALQQQIADHHGTLVSALTGIDSSIAALNAQIADINSATDINVADMESQVLALQAQIDVLDSTVDTYAATLADLQSQIVTLQASIATAIADATSSVATLQAPIDDLVAQKASEQSASDAVIADLQSQVDTKQAELAAAAAAAASSADPASNDVSDQIIAIEHDRDAATAIVQADIDALNLRIQELQASYEPKLAELRDSVNTNSADAVPETSAAGSTGLDLEIQALRDQVAQLERDQQEKINALEQQRNLFQDALNVPGSTGSASGHLQSELERLQAELNAMQNNGADASRQHNLRMEDLQAQAMM